MNFRQWNSETVGHRRRNIFGIFLRNLNSLKKFASFEDRRFYVNSWRSKLIPRRKWRKKEVKKDCRKRSRGKGWERYERIARRNAKNKGGKWRRRRERVENKAEKRGRSPQAQFPRNASGARSTFLLYRMRETRPFKPCRSIDKEISARVPWDYVVLVLVNSPDVL